jgi:hypothetical protein
MTIRDQMQPIGHLPDIDPSDESRPRTERPAHPDLAYMPGAVLDRDGISHARTVLDTAEHDIAVYEAGEAGSNEEAAAILAGAAGRRLGRILAELGEALEGTRRLPFDQCVDEDDERWQEVARLAGGTPDLSRLHVLRRTLAVIDGTAPAPGDAAR